jgi:DNA repair photolyase
MVSLVNPLTHWFQLIMIREIIAKTLLSYVKQPDPYFGLKYNLNLYRGCQHHCIYCDSRSKCYQIEAFDRDVLVKVNAPELLANELTHKRIKGTIGTGSMNDPYMPLESEIQLTRRVLKVISRFGFPVHIITKSDLIVRDVDILQEINKVYATISFTITTADDALGKKLEPGAPLVSKRLKAMKILSDAGIRTGVTLMPVLPFIEDNPDNIKSILEKAADAGAKYIIPAFSVTLRDRQRDYYYNQLDKIFPGLSLRYKTTFGNRYSYSTPGSNKLYDLFKTQCLKLGLMNGIIPYHPMVTPLQPQLGI